MTDKNYGLGRRLPSSEFAALGVPASAPGVLVIDLDALTRNYAKLRAITAPAECAAVAKGDGYGLGAERIAPALFAAGCRTFFVATLAEAVRLRGALPGGATIFVLDGLFPGSGAEFAAAGLQPVLGSLGEIEEWAALCRTQGTPLPAAIHVDTGMNRLGLKAAERLALASRPELLAAFPVSLAMSHLACADTPEHPKNDAQRLDFLAFAGSLGNLRPRLSLANSAGVFLGPDFRFDVVRPGIALYGGNPFASRVNPMEPVISLYGRIAQLGDAEAGETIGYGAALTLKRRMRYITVSTGYADGYFRQLGSADSHAGALGHLADWPLPILGRVSMDLIMFDVTDIPPQLAQRGGFVELIGPRFTVDQAAALAGTIGYEILTSLGPRYHRIYISETSEMPENGNSG
jgi:alanine racemase